MVLLSLVVLPLGLSAAYKTFTGGHSTVELDASSSLSGNTFGMYIPLGMYPIGLNNGISVMLNATLPFVQYSAVPIDQSISPNVTYFVDPKLEPPLPTVPKTYGHNILSINDSVTAVLDTPSSEWIQRVQSTLQVLETVNITAPVSAVVTTYNSSADAHRELQQPHDPFWDYYDGHGGLKTNENYNGWNLGFLFNHWMQYKGQSDRDQTWCFVGFVPYGSNQQLSDFASNARMYSTRRGTCMATYTISTVGMQLAEATCDDNEDVTNVQYQQIIRQNQLVLQEFFLPTLSELFGEFKRARNESAWFERTVTTVVATMYWARLAVIDGPSSRYFGRSGFLYNDTEGQSHWSMDWGLNYTANAQMSSTRSTLRRSSMLYAVLALQPTLTVIAVFVYMILSPVPLGQGFGIVALLAGADIHSLGVLRGAAYSGKLKKKVGVQVAVLDEADGTEPTIQYSAVSGAVTTRSRLKRRVRYA